jgi:hypothetical protein
MPDSTIAPSEGQGGAVPSGSEFADKGEAAAVAAGGLVPAELGGTDAPDDLKGTDPELGSAVLAGGFASDPDVTATGGVDLTLGDNADATSNGGASRVPETPDASAVQTRPDADAVS